MKLVARVKVEDNVVEVNVDEDYVPADIDKVKEYVANELYDILGKTVSQFEVLNMSDIIDDLQQLNEPY